MKLMEPVLTGAAIAALGFEGFIKAEVGEIEKY
jgi:hypothetical protein